MAGIDPRVTIEEFLASHDLEYDRKDSNTFLLTLPGEKKLQTHCALVVGDHSLSINAFVIRKPDDNADQVHAWCMSKNASMYGIAFATNEVGDIFLVGRSVEAVASEASRETLETLELREQTVQTAQMERTALMAQMVDLTQHKQLQISLLTTHY